MFIKIIVSLSLLFSLFTQAAEPSKLGINYQEVTRNELLTEIMLDLEPKLINAYQDYGLDKDMQNTGATGIAMALASDEPYKSIIRRLEETSPDTFLRFLELPKNEFPNLWGLGELERLKREKADSLKLYSGLHGKDYEKKSKN